MFRIIPLFIFILILVCVFHAPPPMEELNELTISRQHLYFKQMDEERKIIYNNVDKPTNTTETEIKQQKQTLAILHHLN